MLITRDIINPDLNYHGKTKAELELLINRWKRLLVHRYQAQRGQTLALGIFTVNHNHLALIFAASELGMKLFLLTKALSMETMSATKLGIHGPVDIVVSQEFNKNDHHPIMFSRYSKHVVHESEIDTYLDDDKFDPWKIHEEDVLVFASTSGTTATSKPVLFSHKDVYEISKRNISVFKFHKSSVVQHLTNMHHASSMLTSLMPSLMISDVHYYGNITLFPKGEVKVYIESELPENFISSLVNRGVDRIQANDISLDLLLITWHNLKPKTDKRLLVNISGSTVPDYLYTASKLLPLDFVSHYGSVDTGIPLIVNYVDQTSSYEEDYLGKVVDDFYVIDGNKVTCKLWKSPRNMPDTLERLRDRFYYRGRNTVENIEMMQLIKDQIEDFSIVEIENDRYLVIWNSTHNFASQSGIRVLFKEIIFLAKEDFVIDTKVSMEQLREYIKHHYGKNYISDSSVHRTVAEAKNNLDTAIRNLKNDYSRHSK